MQRVIGHLEKLRRIERFWSDSLKLPQNAGLNEFGEITIDRWIRLPQFPSHGRHREKLLLEESRQDLLQLQRTFQRRNTVLKVLSR